MKYLLINTVADYGSTGSIVTRAAQRLASEGHEVCIAYGRGNPRACQGITYYKITGRVSFYCHILKARVFDRGGFGSGVSTTRFLRWAEDYAPDVVWLHNLHGYYIHVGKLFRWLKTHPQMQTECGNCPQVKRYPKSLLWDSSKRNFRDKMQAFLGVPHMVLHPVSKWLEALVKQSFLRDYPTEVMYNEVDREIFKPRSSNFRERYDLTNKKMILGVAGKWNDRKGLYDFYELANRLPDDYRVVLTGLNPKQMEALPDNILGVAEVRNAVELAEIYSAADLYVNLSKQETFGMTTLEAHCCGTPVLVLRGTACEEVADQFGGIVTDSSMEAVVQAVKQFFRNENSHA